MADAYNPFGWISEQIAGEHPGEEPYHALCKRCEGTGKIPLSEKADDFSRMVLEEKGDYPVICPNCSGLGTKVEWVPKDWYQHPDPWMDNEPGSLTLPTHWGRISRWKSLTHPSVNTGLPCNCTFYKPRKVARIWHEASKLDWLRKRPDMQTPENQNLLTTFERLKGQVGDKVDPLLPWLAREVKKGRLLHVTDRPREPYLSLPWPEGTEAENWAVPPPRLYHGPLGHIADWYADKRAPNRQGLDIMQHTFPEIFQEKIPEYDKWLEEQQALADAQNAESAPIAHQYPDGWTLRQLRPEDLEYEGNAMGHCVGGYGYGDQVRNGNTLVYSLRDPKHVPHATMEMEPTEWEPDEYVNERNEMATKPGKPVPMNAQIVQIQGKGNEVPKPEYQERIKQWMETMPENERPYWEGGEVTDPRELIGPENGREYEGAQGGYGPHGDYGVGIKDEPYWPSILDNNLGEGGYRGISHHVDPEDIYLAALKRKEIPDLAQALEKHGEEQQDNFNEWRWMNNELTVPDPDWYQEGEEGAYPLELPNGDTIETPEEHEKAYEEDLENWENEHPGMYQTSALYKTLIPHFDGLQYVNEIKPDPTAYAMSRSGRPMPYWRHPAQKMWEAGEVPEQPTSTS